MENQDLYLSIGQTLKRLRLQKSVTIEDAARMCCMKVEAYTLLEAGKKDVRAGKLFEIVHAFGTTMSDFFDECKKPCVVTEASLRQGGMLLFMSTDDYLIDKVCDNHVVCSRVDIYNDCLKLDSKDYIFLIEDVEMAKRSGECIIM